MASIRCKVCGHAKRIGFFDVVQYRAVREQLKCSKCGAKQAYISGGQLPAPDEYDDDWAAYWASENEYMREVQEREDELIRDFNNEMVELAGDAMRI